MSKSGSKKEVKKLISFSLWGSNPLYWVGAADNILLAKDLYPDWICRFYVDEKADKSLIATIEKEQCEIVLMKRKTAFDGLFWRFYAADDADIMICRDTDSRLSFREKKAVDNWLESDKHFHIMRDHPQHGVPILGGMWGCRNVEGFCNLIDIYANNFDQKGCDQNFLATAIYPQVKSRALIHDSYNFFDDGIDFPSKRHETEFVGKVVQV